MKPHVFFGTIAAFLGSASLAALVGALPPWAGAILGIVGGGSTGACAYLLSQGE